MHLVKIRGCSKSIKKLNENTALYFAKQRVTVKSIIMVSYQKTVEDGDWLHFSDLAAPYI